MRLIKEKLLFVTLLIKNPINSLGEVLKNSSNNRLHKYYRLFRLIIIKSFFNDNKQLLELSHIEGVDKFLKNKIQSSKTSC